MKIEKLTENKIRIIVKSTDLSESGEDLHSIMAKSLEDKRFFLDMLLKAEKEVGFNTEGCKLLIEAFSSSDDVLVFTITKYGYSSINSNCIPNQNEKRFTVRKKPINPENKIAIYKFENFDVFCNFCSSINNVKGFEIKKMCKSVRLYLYNNIYYLVLHNINTDYTYLKTFYSLMSEFAKLHSSSEAFQSKLLEHGEIVMKNNAINTGIKYFAK